MAGVVVIVDQDVDQDVDDLDVVVIVMLERQVIDGLLIDGDQHDDVVLIDVVVELQVDVISTDRWRRSSTW